MPDIFPWDVASSAAGAILGAIIIAIFTIVIRAWRSRAKNEFKDGDGIPAQADAAHNTDYGIVSQGKKRGQNRNSDSLKKPIFHESLLWFPGDPNPYCPRCYEIYGKAIHMHLKKYLVRQSQLQCPACRHYVWVPSSSEK